MFNNFTLEYLEVPSGTLRVRHGGIGYPVLLLHGHPRTHFTWWQVASRLASCFQVVCPDLPGFGRSYIPVDTKDHAGSSKRAKAQALIELMDKLGHDRFAVVGHDRGSYAAFRMAMDHTTRVSHLVVADGVPIIEALERANEKFARLWWHWFFFGIPEKQERAISTNPDEWYGGSPAYIGQDAYDDFREATRSPQVIHGMIEDYRAGLGIDRDHDSDDRAKGKQVPCPTLCLWSSRDDFEELYGDVLAVWRPWVRDLSGNSIDSGHHITEEAPEEFARVLARFLKPSATLE